MALNVFFVSVYLCFIDELFLGLCSWNNLGRGLTEKEGVVGAAEMEGKSGESGRGDDVGVRGDVYIVTSLSSNSEQTFLNLYGDSIR